MNLLIQPVTARVRARRFTQRQMDYKEASHLPSEAAGPNEGERRSIQARIDLREARKELGLRGD